MKLASQPNLLKGKADLSCNKQIRRCAASRGLRESYRNPELTALPRALRLNIVAGSSDTSASAPQETQAVRWAKAQGMLIRLLGRKIIVYAAGGL